jgi:hypothetical protein
MTLKLESGPLLSILCRFVDLNLRTGVLIFVPQTSTFEGKFGVNPYFGVTVNVINWTLSIFFLFRQRVG